MTIPLTVACYTSTKNHTLNPVNSFVLVSPSLSLKFHTLRFSVTIINFEQVSTDKVVYQSRISENPGKLVCPYIEQRNKK